MSSAAFPGPSIIGDDALLIIDLDGTLLSVNSYRYFARYLLFGAFDALERRERAALSWETAKILAARQCLHRNHADTKQALRQLWAQHADDAVLERLLHRLQKKVRPGMRDILTAVAQGKADAILATAALADYARPLAMRLGFSYIVAGSQEKYGPVQTLITAESWVARKKIVFTDHLDDLPLMRMADTVYWFGTSRDLKKLRAELPDTDIRSA